ncbi:MAG: dihydroorotate dehydrogenase-like protein [Bacteroidales bacterium]|nr:dihydroorotate dehydrogenase-like protein [Tenuifilaceae bacterium]
MANLQSTYLGLNLKNPLIVSSSGLTSNVESIAQLEANGAAAVVLKSLFEEQILHEAGSLSVHSDYPEAEDYLKAYVTDNNVEKYLGLISGAKKQVEIPVIASINCISASNWIDFAAKIEEAGADAIEINVFVLPTNSKKKSEDYEELYFTLAEKLRKLVSIPIAFKLGHHFTNPLRIVEQLWYRKIQGVVLFNRFFAPDIDIKNLKVISAEVFSKPSDLRDTLRWVAMADHAVPKIDISASTGVHNGEAIIKLLLAGAASVQVCSTLYQNGAAHIKTMLNVVEQWMDANKYDTISQFNGIMNYGQIGDPDVYERSQFMKYFSSHD